MSNSEQAIRASYAFCRRLTRAAGSNLSPCFLLLPARKRRAMDALYAFMRHTDDLADNEMPLEARREHVARWRAALKAALSGDTDRAAAERPGEDDVPARQEQAGGALLPALADTVRRFRVPAEHLYAVVDGVQMDLETTSYETFEDLVAYCERVASAVGLACIHVWGFWGQKAVEPARKCGVAFQLTNILRDLKEDARRGRVYLPREDLRAFEYSAEDLAAGRADERFQRLMRFQIDRARRFFHEGADLLGRLEPDGQRVFGMMVSIYHGLLRQIERRPQDVFSRRIRLGRLRKLGVAARWILLPPRRSALP